MSYAGKKKDYPVSYDKITNVNLVIPDPDMRYYVLKIDIEKEQFVLPFMGKRDMCDAIYVHLLKKNGNLSGIAETGVRTDA